MADEPSNFALDISMKLVEGESFELTEAERAKLTPYERRVLARTALRSDMVARYDLDTGLVVFIKRTDY